jgi:hypothetical protein
MLRVLAILGTALRQFYRPQTPLARAIVPLLLIKVAIILTARMFWFAPMTHDVIPNDVADQFIAPVAREISNDRS